MMHHNTKFGNKLFSGLENIIWTNINHCDLDPECSNPFFFSQDTLAYVDVSSDQVCLPRNQQFRKYSRKSYFDLMSPCCDLDLEDRKNFFLHDTLAHDAASPYQIWSQNGMWFRKYHPDKHWLTFWAFTVTFTLNAVIPFFHRTFWLMMLYCQTKQDDITPRCDHIEDSEPIFSAWHIDSWQYSTIPSLVKKI